MIEKIMEPVAKAGAKAAAKCAEVVSKECVEKGAEIAGVIATWAMTMLLSIWLTSRYKDNVHKELLDKHDEETANRLTEQFNIEVEKLKKEIVELKKELNITKEEAESRFREGVISICKKFGISPDSVLK